MGRYLHTMLRVGDLQRSIDFYSKAFGMNEIRRRDVPDGKYTLAFVGYGNEDSNTVIELTYNYGVEKYDLGGAFGHLAVGVPDVAAACEQAAKAGGTVTRPAGPVKFGTTIIAFVKDPDGYSIELVQRARHRSRGAGEPGTFLDTSPALRGLGPRTRPGTTSSR